MPSSVVSAFRPHIVGVELELLVVVGHGQVDVPQVGDQSLVHRGCSSSGGFGVRRGGQIRAIRPGTSPRSWSSSQRHSCSEASTTVLARSKRRAVNACHSVVVERVGGQQQLGQHRGVLEGLRRALREGGRAGVRGVADQHDPAAVPRRRRARGSRTRCSSPGTGR